MRLELPTFLEEKLATNRDLRSAVDATLTDFDSWLQDSRLPFFPDYTDHGPEHLAGVLATACGLITDEASPVFTAGDAAVLILAVLLHDSAMHLSEAGFRELVLGHASDRRIEEIDFKSWPDLWSEFLFSAKRWDDRKLVDVFGERSAGVPRAAVTDPTEHFDDLQESHRRLVGEFIHLHHPRLAHEFAVFGVPGPGPDAIKPDSRFGTDLCDVAGLIARSHGMDARKCLPYLSSKYHYRAYKDVHAVYVMALLRISDYLQIQADRSPAVVFRYKHIPSPVSVQEHQVHRSITNITQAHSDPDSIEINADPPDVWTFLRLKEWLAGIQCELDASWAVLGEVYGSHAGLRHLGLSIRRVRSNLDNVDSFARRVEYVPRRIEFDVARSELLNLLIGPLYGHRPEIGIRELVQNAVDAVREMSDLQEQNQELRSIPRIEQRGDVEVRLCAPDSSGHAWLTVSDRGVGMTADTVQQFFLKAGASYRESDLWRRQHENEDTHIRSRVLRSGRFGVGALAAFLLGDQVQVTTRHVTASKALTFATQLEHGPIELRYTDQPVGTVIRVLVTKDVFKRLTAKARYRRWPDYDHWDWYQGSQPTVLRFIGDSDKPIRQHVVLPGPGSTLSAEWSRLSHEDFADIHWTFGKRTGRARLPNLSCNGIRIGQPRQDHIDETDLPNLAETTHLRVRQPHLSVYDPDCNLPLTVQRYSLATDELPFRRELLSQVLKDIIAHAVVQMGDESRDPVFGLSMRSHPALWPQYFIMPQLCPYFATPEGVAIAAPALIGGVHPKSAVVMTRYEYSTRWFMPPMREPFDVYFAVSRGRAKHLRNDNLRSLWEAGDPAHQIGHLPIAGKRIVASSDWVTYVMNHRDVPMYVKRDCSCVAINDEWSFIEMGECENTHIDVDGLKNTRLSGGEESPALAVELFFATPEEEPASTRAAVDEICQVWLEILGQTTIPFDANKRLGVLSGLPELHPYIHRQKSLASP